VKPKFIFIPVIVLTFILAFTCFTRQNTTLPENVIGTWTTSEKKYRDRFFELTQNSVTFGIGKKKTNVYDISNVKKDVQDNEVLYTIKYHNSDGVQYTLSFYYDATNGGMIKFKNQKNIKWRKNKDTDFEENPEADNIIKI
jgi:hypothetical protein